MPQWKRFYSISLKRALVPTAQRIQQLSAFPALSEPFFAEQHPATGAGTRRTFAIAVWLGERRALGLRQYGPGG